jgi:S-adenosylmethionine/arginine decarboxylase-like enzyme
LMIDMVGCNPEKVSNADFIYLFMKRLAKEIGMNPMGAPHIDLYNGVHPEWCGWSSTLHIQESHITFHWFNWGAAYGDIFSCKDFDMKAAVDFMMGELEADKHEPRFSDPELPANKEAAEFLSNKMTVCHFVARGPNFPPSLK